jgi:replicative DNA helicase
MQIENSILKHLLLSEEYLRKVLPFIKDEYFSDKNDKIILDEITKYVHKYNSTPTVEALSVEFDNRTDLRDDEYSHLVEYSKGLVSNRETSDVDWLVDVTEKFCQEKAVYNAVMKSISILDESKRDDTSVNKGAIPEILSEALGVTFDSHVGHDFIDDFDTRFDFYHKKEVRTPFDIDYLNKVTGGGLPDKTLNIILAGTNVGKSMFMCHAAANNLMDGKNVLYITMEMAEERIAERIDANLLNVPIGDIRKIAKQDYDKKIEKIKKRTTGKMIVKEYPTAGASVTHFRHLLQELKQKRKFIPDIIYIDYLNICASSRMKMGSSVNSYTFIKAIAEELRGLAVENNLPIVSATQTTRSGYTNSDVGLEDTSESFGLPATADFMIALVRTEELDNLGQIMVKQLKNRYGDPNTHKRFVIGVDTHKMKFYDVEDSAQTLTGNSATQMTPSLGTSNSQGKRSFEGFNA